MFTFTSRRHAAPLLSVPALLAALTLTLAPALAAQTLSGSVSDGNGGPLLSGQVYLVTSSIVVPTGTTLTVQPGAVVKFNANQQLAVQGTLNAGGTLANPVHFTSFADDSVGGDTNGDGASVGTPGDWRGLQFQAGSDASALSHAVVAYGGASGFANVEITTSDVSLSDCVVRDGAGVGIDLNNSNARPTVSDCAILDNGGVAVDALMLAAVAGFVDNSATGNGRDAMEIDAATQLTADLTITADNVLGGALIVNATQTIPAAATLTLGPGVALKFADFQQLVVNGTLVANGASGNDVVFTALADDATGGDTNGDGASVGTPGAWRGLFFQAGSDASALSHAVVAYGGASGFAGVEITTSDVSLSDCVVRDGAGVGIDLNNSNARPMVSDCAILDNGGVAVDALMLAAVPGFVDNVASGNGRDAMEVDAVTQITSDVTIGAENTLGGVLVVSISQTVPAAKTLTVSAGVVLKFAAAQQLAVNGGLVLDGDPRSRVVFTSIHDDEIGGDSNGDGVTSTPMPGDWRGLILSGAATGPVALANTTVTYGGASGFASVANSSPLATLRAVRVEHADADGFDISQHAGILRDCVAFACQGHGFDLISGSYDLRGCSSVDNGGAGYRAAAAWTGEIRNSIAWDNVGAPFAGLVVNDVFFSNGEPTFSGTNGNRHLDPKFVDQTNGNLRLSSISGLIDVGDFPYLPSGQDADGFPRDLDGLLDGVRRTDIGAHEFSNLELEVIGAPLAGGTISVELSGTPGLVNTNLIAGLSEFEASFKRFGNLFVDLGGINTIFAWPSAPSAVPLPLPIELPIGLEIHLQAITFTGPMPSQSAGNLSNPITLTVE